MKPYFQEGGIAIYHGDCREILPTLQEGLTVITDQPYGTGWVRGGGKKAGEFKAKHEQPEWDVWSVDWIAALRLPKRVAAFCPVSRLDDLCLALPNPAVLYYQKSNVRPGGIDREPIVVSPPPNGCLPKWRLLAYNGDMPDHPCQKPIDVMDWLVGLLSNAGDVIVDPFMGSGTTLVAAKEYRRRAIGIEIEEKYCEIAAKRLAQGVLTFPEITQGAL